MHSSQPGETAARSQSADIGALIARTLAYARENATARATPDFGPVRLKIEVCGRFLSRIALDPLRHAANETGAPADLHLVMIDSRETGVAGPSLESLATSSNGREQRPTVDKRQPILTVSEEWGTSWLLDANARKVIVWFDDATAAPEWMVYFQIRNALHWLSYRRSFGLFHAAALRLDGVGCLITGKGGSGKSTMAAAAIASGFDAAGDDFVLVETTPVPRVHAVFETLMLDKNSLVRVPQFQSSIRVQRQPDQKGVVHLLDTSSRDRLATDFPLHAILGARLTGHQSSRVVKAEPAQVFRALAPSTLLLLRSQSRQIWANCSTLVERLGTYTFEIGTDVGAAVAELARFMNGLKQ